MPEGKFNQENSTQEPEIEILSSQAETFDEAGDASGMKETEGQASPAISAEVEEWKNKHDEMKEKMMWVAADFDNFKKRTLKEKEDYLKFSQASLLKEILVVGDNLERALGTLVAADGEKGVAANLKQGLELTLKQFTSFLEKHGVAKIKALGEKFDPRFHEVMFQEETDKFPDETVMEELQSGYLLNERVLRPALVKVAKNHKAKEA